MNGFKYVAFQTPSGREKVYGYKSQEALDTFAKEHGVENLMWIKEYA